MILSFFFSIYIDISVLWYSWFQITRWSVRSSSCRVSWPYWTTGYVWYQLLWAWSKAFLQICKGRKSQEHGTLLYYLVYLDKQEIFPGKYTPSPCHKFIATLERKGKLLRNYTQNIDTLEKTTGISRVLYCHGMYPCRPLRYSYPIDLSLSLAPSLTHSLRFI